MTGNRNPYQRYRQEQVETADQGTLIIMMFDGALKFTRQAKEAINKKDIVGAHKSINRAQDIVVELMCSLDLEAGEVAGNLFRLYDYAYNQLKEANLQKKVEPAEEAEKVLTSLRESWEQVVKGEAQGVSSGT